VIRFSSFVVRHSSFVIRLSFLPLPITKNEQRITLFSFLSLPITNNEQRITLFSFLSLPITNNEQRITLLLFSHSPIPYSFLLTICSILHSLLQRQELHANASAEALHWRLVQPSLGGNDRCFLSGRLKQQEPVAQPAEGGKHLSITITPMH
jgi:hypothetical protein